MTNVRISILDDHQIVIDGLKLLLESTDHLNVVLENTNGFELLKKLKEQDCNIDILLLDLMMPVIGGYEFALMMKKEYPAVKIIVLSMNNDGKTIYNLIENADIKGFLPKSVNRSELVAAIEKIAAGGQHFSDEILSELSTYKKIKKENDDLKLSSRELEIIALIAKGYTNKQLSQTLFISEKTVETHRKNIFRKTDTHNVGSLIELVNRLKLI